MTTDITRRNFVTTLSAGLAFGQAPTMLTRRTVKPVVIADLSGAKFRNGGTQNCVEKAFSMITSGGDVLDALIAGVNIPELDPEETGIGYGGLPNAEGVVQLDSCCMHGPKKRAGGVAAIEGVRTPSLVARAVMDYTDHHLLVGKGAQDFARSMGFTIEKDLNTEKSRQLWLEWKRRSDPEHYLDPKKRQEAGYREALQMVREGLIPESSFWGTINCDGIGPGGDICGVTTTSGLAWKIPGSTGRGEANLYNLTSFLIVENMRRGMHPKDAGLEGLRRIKANTVENRLLNDKGEPAFNIRFFVLNKKGEYAGVAMYASGESTFALCTENGAATPAFEALLSGP